MSYDWNNSNKNDLPTVTRTTSSASLPTSSSAPIQQTLTASLPPPTSQPLSSMRYHRGGGEINSHHQILSHQSDRILPHGHSGKNKKGAQSSRCPSAEVNECQPSHPPPSSSSSEQDSGTSVVQQKRSFSETDRPLIQNMEMELDFLKGECSTIDIILSSLRTAFLRDGTDAFSNTGSFIPLATSSVSSFSSFSVSSLAAVSSPTPSTLPTVSASSSSSSSPTASTSSSHYQQQQEEESDEILAARQKERQKEMLFGYDEISLQVRQLEKKLDSLEYKIRQHYMDKHKRSRR